MTCGTCGTETPHEEVEGQLVGKIAHYYGNINVGIVELEGELKVGDNIRIKGGKTDFEQEVESMQIEHKNVESAGKGDVIGLKVSETVKEGDQVYKL